MYESKDQPLLPNKHFARRLALHMLYALGLIFLALFLGVMGHLWLVPVSWHDALLNTALIVGGIGPYMVPDSAAGKIFFALYSIFIGLVFMATLGLVLAPLAHRIIHKFHLDGDDD